MTSSRQEANKLPSLSTGTIPGLVPNIDRLSNGHHDWVVVTTELVARQALVAALSRQADEARRRKMLFLHLGRLVLGLLGRPGLGLWFCQRILHCCRRLLGRSLLGLLRGLALIPPLLEHRLADRGLLSATRAIASSASQKRQDRLPRQPRRRIRTSRRGSCQPSCW